MSSSCFAFDHLADELINAILDCLEAQALARIRTVCKTFLHLADDIVAKRAQDALKPQSSFRFIFEIGEPYANRDGSLLQWNPKTALQLKSFLPDSVGRSHRTWLTFPSGKDCQYRFSDALHPGSLAQLMAHANLVETRSGPRQGLAGITPILSTTCVRIKSALIDIPVGDYAHLNVSDEADLIIRLISKESGTDSAFYIIEYRALVLDTARLVSKIETYIARPQGSTSLILRPTFD